MRIGPRRLLHIEFFTRAPSDVGPRMLIYLGRLRERYPRDNVEQHVVVLGTGTPASAFLGGEVFLHFQVHLFRESDPEELLATPATMPFAVLARAQDLQERKRLLVRSLKCIYRSGDARWETLREMAITFASIYLVDEDVDVAEKEAEMPLELELWSETKRKHRVREKFLRHILGDRFGVDPAVERVAYLLAWLDADDALDAIDRATSLDELREMAAAGARKPPCG